MKIALLADIHANFAALETVTTEIDAWQPDLVIVAGDLVNRGPKPKECLKFVHRRILDQNWYWLRGNHEDYVIDQSKANGDTTNPATEVHRASRWTLEQLIKPDLISEITGYPESQKNSDSNLGLIKEMPFQINLLDPAGQKASFVHASMTGIRDGIYPEMTNEKLEPKVLTPIPEYSHPSVQWIGSENHKANLSLFGVGHTHRPLVRHLNGTLVVNAGSAGLPFDQDTRPSYAQLTYYKNQWRAEIKRFDYDLQQAVNDFYTTGYLEDGGALVNLVLIELQTAQSQLYHWAIRYQEQALRGEISMDESVERYLSYD